MAEVAKLKKWQPIIESLLLLNPGTFLLFNKIAFALGEVMLLYKLHLYKVL